MSLPSRPVAILVALREELDAVSALLKGSRPVSRSSLRGIEGHAGDLAIVAARTGIGAANAARRTVELIDGFQPSLILATGFGGALRQELSTGDVLVASEVVEAVSTSETDQDFVPAGRWKPPPRLLQAALDVAEDREGSGSTPGRVLAGRLITASRVCKTPAEKHHLGLALAADGVEMESSAILKEATERGVPVLCFRAILDDSQCELPFDFGKILTPSGDPRPAKVLAEVLRHPSKAKAVADLAARARKARSSLMIYLQALLARKELRDPES